MDKEKERLLWVDEPPDYYDKHGLWMPDKFIKKAPYRIVDKFIEKNPELFIKPWTQLELPLTD